MRITDAKPLEVRPTDPLWGQQWGLELVKAPNAWAVTKGSPGIVVAVLDTGVDLSQPDLQGAFVPGHDFVNDDGDPSDDHGHGTTVAGIVAARADNGLGGAGVCPRCSLMPLKVVAADGTASEAHVTSGITWAVDHGARVINLSLGGPFSAAVAGAVDYATSKGVLVVASAGNNGNIDAFYPAANPSVLGVAATQPNDQLFAWSNFGSWVAVAAPGCDVTTHRGGVYAEVCGTSASTPVAAGVAALAMSYAPAAAAETVKRAMTSSASAVAGVAHGRVDLVGTLAKLGATFPSAPPPVATPSVPTGPAASGASGSTPGARPKGRSRVMTAAARSKFRSGSRAARPARFLRVEIRRRWR